MMSLAGAWGASDIAVLSNLHGAFPLSNTRCAVFDALTELPHSLQQPLRWATQKSQRDGFCPDRDNP
jgi:hypothetical protein